ncbi:hypothetical protein [Gemmatimonas groenlandica]|uniref:Ig-like domain-containing protein n=1 Tax=Gemmatimonas groenlandica TaxID=2732249 RepID=A0A6M4IS42_9BACT|nr:hypothetical protein [Gemmatimonas groenlandica]QJR37734.1 hypothetical protein HKW67_20510 [Gemmatimonas groenlandica]
MAPLTFALVVAACEKPAIRWVDAEAVATNLPSPLVYPPYVATDSTLDASSPYADFLLTQDLWREAGGSNLLEPTLTSMPEARDSVANHATLPPVQTASAPLTSLGNGNAPADSLRCARSIRVVSAGARGHVAVWWSRGAAGRVRLAAAWRDSVVAPAGDSTAGGVAGASVAVQGSAWRGPIMIDSLDQGPGDAQAADRGAYGCARPAPSVAIDKKYGYVHVAYALTGPEGPGVFYAHQMDPRSQFEPPVAIIYGERIGDARVAVDADVVAVAYEDPNSGLGRRKIGLAVSRTSGHLFEDRLTASGGISDARDPHVLVRGRAVVVGWSETAAGADPIFRLRRARVER